MFYRHPVQQVHIPTSLPKETKSLIRVYESKEYKDLLLPKKTKNRPTVSTVRGGSYIYLRLSPGALLPGEALTEITAPAPVVKKMANGYPFHG